MNDNGERYLLHQWGFVMHMFNKYPDLNLLELLPEKSMDYGNYKVYENCVNETIVKKDMFVKYGYQTYYAYNLLENTIKFCEPLRIDGQDSWKKIDEKILSYKDWIKV